MYVTTEVVHGNIKQDKSLLIPFFSYCTSFIVVSSNIKVRGKKDVSTLSLLMEFFACFVVTFFPPFFHL